MTAFRLADMIGAFQFVLDTPKCYGKSPNGQQRTDTTGVPPLWRSARAALIACDGFITLGLWLDGSIIILFVGYGEIGSCPIFWVGKDRLTTFQSLAAAWQVVAYRCTRLCSSQSQRESIWRMGIHLSRNAPVFATQRKTGQEVFVLSPCSPWESAFLDTIPKVF